MKQLGRELLQYVEERKQPGCWIQVRKYTRGCSWDTRKEASGHKRKHLGKKEGAVINVSRK
jgi:hypothetical protein